MRAIAIPLAVAALLSSCSPEGESPPQKSGDGTTAEVLGGAGTGNRLRHASAPEDLRPLDVSDDQLGCSGVDTHGQFESLASRQDEARNRVVVTARGEIVWNDTRIDATTLRQYLDIVAQMRPRPLTIVRTEADADPRAVEGVRDAVSRSLHCDLESY